MGQGFRTCYQCEQFRRPGWTAQYAVDQLIPITYSPDDGLESLLHQYKRSTPGSERVFLGAIVASVLFEFLQGHERCIERGGTIDFAALVPPRKSRSFSPMGYAVSLVRAEWPWPWWTDLVMNRSGQRPARGKLQPELFAISDEVDVAGKSVLLVDDTWTSGSTMSSVAARLKSAGVARVVGVPIGRQIRADTYGADLYESAHAGSWTIERCILCT